MYECPCEIQHCIFIAAQLAQVYPCDLQWIPQYLEWFGTTACIAERCAQVRLAVDLLAVDTVKKHAATTIVRTMYYREKDILDMC